MKKVVFACGENKKRSQMAEAIFNHFAKDDIAISGGTSPAEEVDPKTIKVLQEIGIEAKNPTPKLLTNSMLDEADIIISFGCLVPSLFPKEKFQEWKIKDPVSTEDFRAVRDEILKKVKILQSNSKN